MPDNGESILAKMRAAFEIDARLDLQFDVRDPKSGRTTTWTLSMKPVKVRKS